jgi:DNA-binding CsgD family transcriptional regulator
MIEGYAADFAACTTLEAVRETFRRAVAREGITTSASRAWFGAGEKSTTQNYFRNWTKEWAQLSDEKGFSRTSFVVAEARRRIAPFTWAEAREQRQFTPADRELWGIVHEWGFFDGFVVPVHGPQGYFATVSVASSERELDFRPELRLRLRLIALLAHERCFALSPFAPQEPPCRLSERERECLRWVAAGKTDWEIGVILSISSATARFHVDRARQKLGTRTRSQAVARVALLGL